MGYVEGYLRTNLGLPLELVHAVLGWRCVGWEGKSNPDHCVVNAVPGSDGRSFETLLTWEPTEATNVPLDVAACTHLKNLYTSVRDRIWMSLTSRPDDIYDVVIPLRVVNPLALIPIFTSACNVEKVVDPNARVTDVEFSGVLGFVTTGTPSDLAMTSVTLPRTPLRLWGFEPSDPRDIFTVPLDSGVPYAAITVHLKEESDSWILSWIMSRGRAKGVEKFHLTYSGSVVVGFSIDDVSFSDLSRDQWNSWLQRASSSRAGGAKVRRVERDGSCDHIFDIPEAYIDAARNDSLLVRRVRDCGHSVEIVNPVDGKDQKQIFHLPYPIDQVCGRLQMDGIKEARFEVRKGKYSIESLFLADSQNKSCWFETTNVPQSYVEWLLPQQFSPNEQLRGELGKLQWTSLCACKGIASTILLNATEGRKIPLYFQTEDEETGRTQSLMLFVGSVRRDECTGNLAVDLKWIYKPLVISPRALRNQVDWPSHPPMTNGEFKAVLKMLKVRSEGEPETRESNKRW